MVEGRLGRFVVGWDNLGGLGVGREGVRSGWFRVVEVRLGRLQTTKVGRGSLVDKLKSGCAG